MNRLRITTLLSLIFCSLCFAQSKVSVQPISMIFGLPLVDGREWKANYFYQYNDNAEYTLSGSLVKVRDDCVLNIDCNKSNLSRELISVGWKYLWHGIYGNPKLFIGHCKSYYDDLELGISSYDGLYYGAEFMIGYQFEYKQVFSFLDGGLGIANLGKEIDVNFGVGYIF